MAAKIETGVQLLARLSERPSLSNLEPALFGNEGPNEALLVEFVGDEGSGKTQTLQHTIANAVLPKTWKGIELKGMGVGVVLIDTDFHFCLLRLSSILENRVNFSINNRKLEEDQDEKDIVSVNNADIENLVKQCLDRLFILRCNSTTQLVMSLYSLSTLLGSKPDIAMLIIDSVSAFYWIDRSVTTDSTSAKNSAQQRVLRALDHVIKTFSVFTIVTRASIFAPKSSTKDPDQDGFGEQWNYLGRQWQQAISCSYAFSVGSGTDGKLTFTVCFQPPGAPARIRRQFYINEYGLNFLSLT